MKKRIYINRQRAGIISLGCMIILWISPLSAAPGADDLLKACEASLENGFQGIQGDLCIWYVTPCDCEYGKASELPRVCLPESISTETLADKVVRGLIDQPELQAESADFAAAMILSRIYPCIE